MAFGVEVVEMGDGRGDFQRVWHEFAGKYFNNKSILDIGAGYGYSRTRLECDGHNRVTLQDIDRSLMNVCDIIQHIDKIEGFWDIVTAFDVIEHAVDPQNFLARLFPLARIGVLFTTPSRYVYDHPWHFYPDNLCDMVSNAIKYEHFLEYFARYREGECDEIHTVTREKFFYDRSIYAYGLYVHY